MLLRTFESSGGSRAPFTHICSLFSAVPNPGSDCRNDGVVDF
jgi:hypothetical protein